MDTYKVPFLTLIVFFFILSLIYTSPLILFSNSGIPYTRTPLPGWEIIPLYQGDHFQLYYHLWLAKDVLFRDYPFFSNPYEFQVGEKSIFCIRRIPLSIPYCFFSLILGNVLAYNLLVFSSIILSGVGMFLLSKLYIKDSVSSLLSACIFAVAPFGISQILGGHTNGFLLPLVPFTIYFYEKALIEGKIRYGIFAGLCILSFSFIEYHLFYYIILFSVLFFAYKYFWEKKKIFTKTGALILLFILVSLLSVFYLKSVEISGSTEASGREIGEVSLYSPHFIDFFRRTNTDSEKYIYLGYFPLLLLIFAAYRMFTSKEELKKNRFLLFYLFVFVVTAILSLGPNLQIVPLYYLCYKFLPFFKFSRVPGRIFVFTILSLGILSGYGLYLLKERFKNKHLFVVLLFIGVLIVDYFPSSPVGISRMDEDNKVYKIIKEDKDNFRVLELPIWPGDCAWSSVYQYYITITRKPMINGYYPLVPAHYVDNVFYPLVSMNVGDISREQYDILRKLDVKYVVFHEEAFPQKVSHYPAHFSLRRLLVSPYLEFIKKNRTVWLFRLNPLSGLRKSLTKETGGERKLKTSVIGAVFEAEKQKINTGKIIKDSGSSNGWVVYASKKDKAGFMNYGRQQIFPKGSYLAYFRIKARKIKAKDPVAIIDICVQGGNPVLSRKVIRGYELARGDSYQDVVISFNLGSPEFIELRVYFTKKADIYLDYIYVISGEHRDPILSFEAEELYYRGLPISDKNASDGVAVKLERKDIPQSEVIYGPYRRFGAGKYTVRFRMKVDNVLYKDVAVLQVTSDFGKVILSQKVLNGNHFKKADKYQIFEVPFKIDRPQILEFRIIFLRTTDLYIDIVSI